MVVFESFISGRVKLNLNCSGIVIGFIKDVSEKTGKTNNNTKAIAEIIKMRVQVDFDIKGL